MYFIIGVIIVLALLITHDWLLYRLRGKAEPDSPDQENPPVITGAQDAMSQWQVDLSKKNNQKHSDQ